MGHVRGGGDPGRSQPVHLYAQQDVSEAPAAAGPVPVACEMERSRTLIGVCLGMIMGAERRLEPPFTLVDGSAWEAAG